MDMREIFVTHKHVDHLMGIAWMVRMICQFMNHGEYKGEANIYVHDEAISLLREMADKLILSKKTRFILREKGGARYFGEYISCRRLKFPIKKILVKDNEVLYIGDIKIEAIPVPGHTAGHLAYLIDDKYLFTGDAI